MVALCTSAGCMCLSVYLFGLVRETIDRVFRYAGNEVEAPSLGS